MTTSDRRLGPAGETDATPARARLDHLVVVADSLEQGVAWCEATLGVTPGPGGQHVHMGTHNRLLRLAGAPAAYLEIIAVDPAATRPPGAPRRWFGMDEPAVRAAVALAPRLLHFVVATDDIDRDVAAWLALGENPGRPVAASRATPQGELRWRITLRDDGRPRHQGALPSLIEWQGTHPTAAMVEPVLGLRWLRVASPVAEALGRAWQAIGFGDGAVVASSNGETRLEACLTTPRGEVVVGADGALPAQGSRA